MAIDKAQNTNTEIDLDDVEVRILMIVKNPSKISPASNFLTRRGWPTTVLSNISRAVEFATDEKPDIVLLSVNHPNPALQRLSDLLTNTFGCTVVAFAESSEGHANARLSKMPVTLKIHGQASGPNLHRSLRKILAEKYNIQIDEKVAPAERAAGAKTLPAKTGATDDKNSMQKPDGLKGRGPTMIRGEADVETESDEDSVNNGKYKLSKKARRSLKDFSPPTASGADGGNGRALPSSASTSKDLAAQLKKSLFGESGSAEPDSYEDVDDESAAWSNEAKAASDSGRPRLSDVRPGDRSALEAEVENPAKRTESAGADSTSAPSSAVSTSARRAPVPFGESGLVHTPTPLQRAEQKKSVAIVSETHSLMMRAVKEALAKICRPKSSTQATIQTVEQVGVFPLDSTKMPGYLVLAWPHAEMQAIEPFFKRAQQFLGETFRELKVPANVESGFFVQLPPVQFAPWAAEESVFFFSTAHGHEEIGVAFFATHQPLPKPKPGEDKSMCAIDINSLSTDEPVNFKVYLHMKKNKKYFLYLRNGRQLQPEQKDRLTGHKVRDVYMKTIDVENLRMFMASCHLKRKMKKAG